jgi:hypothetical protein
MIQQHVYRRILHLALFLLAILPLATPASARSPGDGDIPSFEIFLQSVMNGEPSDLRGLYVPGLLADAIVVQPEGNPAYVSSEDGVVTQFALAEEYGTFGLLAHNYLAGEEFSRLDEGQSIVLIYGNGKTDTFIVRQILRYQALSPRSVTSNFVDLQTEERLSASELFQRVYNRPGDVVLQTCIYSDGDPSWGRLFIIAVPVEEYDPRSMPGSPTFSSLAHQFQPSL